MAITKSEYVARMDADDIAMSNQSELQVNYLDNHPEIAMLGCNVLLFDDNGIWGTHTLKESPEKNTFLKHPNLFILPY